MLLAVSGGADSMALLHGVRAVVNHTGICRVTVAHLNHGLRGSESDADADLVKRTCDAMDLELFTETMEPEALKSSSKGSLEESARTTRYEFLLRTASSQKISIVATAHHQQDQIETLVFNILRGTGLRGLVGIPEIRELATDVRLIRPMLRIHRSTVRDFVFSKDILFREDASNATAEFARNRIRHLLKMLPLSLMQELESRLLQLSEQSGATMSTIEVAAETILNAAIVESSAIIVRLNRNKLREWPEPLIRHALISHWIHQQWPRKQMNSSQWERLSQAVFTGTPRRWSFPGGIRLRINRLHLILEKL